MQSLFEEIYHKVLEVGSFVYLTTFLYYVFLHHKIHQVKTKNVFVASLLGASPGCAGAIVSATLFNYQKVSFGFVVASMIATMGDGAFLLLLTKPGVFFYITIIAILVGNICGYLVNRKVRPTLQVTNALKAIPKVIKYHQKHAFVVFKKYGYLPFTIVNTLLVIIASGRLLGIFDHNFTHHPLINSLSLISLILIVINFVVVKKLKTCKIYCAENCFKETSFAYALRNAFEKTSEVLMVLLLVSIPFWFLVNKGFLDLAFFQNQNIYLVILLSAIIGFLPGSIFPILVLSAFLNNAWPLSGLLATCLVSTGDAGLILIKNYPKRYWHLKAITFGVGVIVAFIFAWFRTTFWL